MSSISSSAFGLINNWMLWLLVATPLIVAIANYSQTLKILRLKTLGLSGARNFWFLVCSGLIISLLTLALARPYRGYEDLKISGSGKDILILADISLSMLAKDTPPDRLTLLKDKIDALVRISRAKGFSDRFGLITFAGDAYLFCPLTADSGVLKSFTDALGTTIMTSPGSDFEKALNTAFSAFENAKAAGGEIVILSDGEESERDFSALGAGADSHHIRINAIGIGTSEGGPIPKNYGEFVKDNLGNIVVSKLSEESLKELTTSTKGVYAKVTIDDKDVISIISGIHRDTLNSVKKEGSDSTRIYHEFGPLLVGVILLLIVLALALNRPEWIIPCLLIATHAAHPIYAQERQEEAINDIPSANQAYEAYQSGDFKEALRGFERAAKASPDDHDLAQSLASTRYKLGDFAGSERDFKRALRNSSTGRESFESLYGLGNSSFMQKRYQDAIKQYEEALKINPNDKDTQANLELARKLLEEQNKNKSNSSSSNSSSSNKESSSSNNSQSQSSSSASGANSESSSSDGTSASSQDNSSSESGESSSASNGSSSSTGSAGSKNSSSGSQESPEGKLSSNGSSSQGEEHQTDLGESSASADSSVGDLERWLDNIDDSPLLPPKNLRRSQRDRNGQTW